MPSGGGGAAATSRVRDVIAGLTASLFEDGNLPSSITSTAGNKLVQWCHGAPGLLPLLAAAIGHPGPSVVRGSKSVIVISSSFGTFFFCCLCLCLFVLFCCYDVMWLHSTSGLPRACIRRR